MSNLLFIFFEKPDRMFFEIKNVELGLSKDIRQVMGRLCNEICKCIVAGDKSYVWVDST